MADELAARASACADLPALADAVCTAVHTAVPFSFGCLATTDPATGLISWAYKTRPLEIGDEDWAAAEYGAWDVNQFADIAARAEPVGVLSIDTDDRPETCRRFRDFLVPHFGFTDELRIVFRTQGLTWGALALNRGADEPSFTADEARTVVAVHALVADLIRHALFDTDRSTPYLRPALP